MHTTFKGANSTSTLELHFYVPPKSSDVLFFSQLRCVSTACAMIVPSSSAVSESSTPTRLLFTRPPPKDLCQRLPCPYPPIQRRRMSCCLNRVHSELMTKIRAKCVFLSPPTLLTCTLPSMNLRQQRWLARLPAVR